MTCNEENCNREGRARGKCKKHYDEHARKGTLPETQKISPEDRFWVKVNFTEGCWNWTAGTSQGYGRFVLSGKREMSHRVAFQWAKGEIPEEQVVHHTCFNRKCVNPEHLVLTSRAENSAIHPEGCRCSGCNPEAFKKSKCIRGHDLTLPGGRSDSGGCRDCRRNRNREWMQKYREKMQ